jgi:hypothetical protein
MANAMLQAIGPQATYPDRQVNSISGHGGFSMMMGDFITLGQMRFRCGSKADLQGRAAIGAKRLLDEYRYVIKGDSAEKSHPRNGLKGVMRSSKTIFTP